MISQTELTSARALVVVSILFAAVICASGSVIAAESDNEFSRTSIDVGLVVDDVEKMEEFYTKALGFREAEGFSMSGALAKRIGLTKGSALKIRVLALGEDKTATRLKLIPLPQDETAVKSRGVVNTRSGFRYITVFVADIDRVLKRLTKAGVQLSADDPVRLGSGSANEVFVMLVRDPEGNHVELVGPREGTNAH